MLLWGGLYGRRGPMDERCKAGPAGPAFAQLASRLAFLRMMVLVGTSLARSMGL